MSTGEIDRDWLARAVAEWREPHDDEAVGRLWRMLSRCARTFADGRADVYSPRLGWPVRGLQPDEARAFLRAVEAGLVEVDDAGYFTLPGVRPSGRIGGRYPLLSKYAAGVRVELEHLVQVGALAELVLDHGWSADRIELGGGEFALQLVDDVERVVVVVEARARVTGRDGAASLVSAWLDIVEGSSDAGTFDARRKLRELARLTGKGPVLLWLVASGVRWPLWAERRDGRLVLTPGEAPVRALVQARSDGREPGQSRWSTPPTSVTTP